jgi:tripartite ATP-independent transporter DctP family solute receptor
MEQETKRSFLAKACKMGALAAAGVAGVGPRWVRPIPAGAASNEAGKKITARLVLDLAVDDPRTKGVMHFAELAAKYTNGEVEVQVFPNDTLATEMQAIRLMRNGSLSMATVGGALASLDPIWSFIGLPYLFKSYEDAEKLFTSSVALDILDMLTKFDLVGLAFFSDGFRDVTNSRRPIVEPSDMAGLKIRVVNSASWISTFRALGANPTPMDFGQLYIALKTKVVDAQEGAPTTILLQKFYETQSYLSLTEHIFQPVPLIVSKIFWDGLSKDIQTELQKAAHEATEQERQLVRATSQSSVDKLGTLGLKVNEVHKAAFVKQTESVYPEVEAGIPGLADLVRKIRDVQA